MFICQENTVFELKIFILQTISLSVLYKITVIDEILSLIQKKSFIVLFVYFVFDSVSQNLFEFKHDFS